jgi:hypothetical protein
MPAHHFTLRGTTMKFVKLAVLMLAAACLFSACTVYNQEAPKSSKAPSNSPVQQ